METIGGGVILDDCPPRHKRHQPEVIRALTIREGGSAGAQLQQLVEEYGYALPTAQTLAQRQSMPEEEMVRALEDLVNSGDLLEILPRRYLAAPCTGRPASRWSRCWRSITRPTPSMRA
ncbi:MAG: hypothetical protein ACLR01_13525 [Vescimonas sp.]